jgi:hypothetical protein
MNAAMQPTRDGGRTTRIWLLAASACVQLAALLGHGWTSHPDVTLGLFGGRYCNVVRCETWSWERMGVADRMTVVGIALFVVGIVSVVATVAVAVATARQTLTSSGVMRSRVVAAITAACAIPFVWRFEMTFHKAAPLGWAMFGMFGALVVVVAAARPSAALKAA